MSFFTGLKRIFIKDKLNNLRENPAIIINFCSESQATGHCLLVCNTDNYKVHDEYVTPRRRYQCYPRDVDENMEEDEIEQLLNTQKDIIVPKGFYDVFGVGTLSKYRTIIFVFPSEPDNLPAWAKDTWIAKLVFEKSLERKFIEQMKQKDVDANLLYNETLSLYTESVKQDMTSFALAMKNIQDKAEKEQQKTAPMP